ncbi:MAG TPA: NDP-hexose 2,3-dehydratase family protein [Pseudonocardia sp.]|nr:NDP-hexose 2,3-dehydratase family protein [Pseudonocardia sp.]
MAAREGLSRTADFMDWFSARARAESVVVTRIDFDDLVGWGFRPEDGNLVHTSGKFFSVEGLEVRTAFGPVAQWSQPIINQPETGVLGILAKEFDGVQHFLMQAKMEPGNCNVLQLSPTVQATRSNYTAVHRGRAVPYLDRFVDAPPRSVLADVAQSEQGSWFYRKRNRNMVVEVTDDVEVLDGFHWLTLGQLHQLFAFDNLVNMNSRTVLSCLPFCGAGAAESAGASDGFGAALARSIGWDAPARHTTGEILSWITDLRSRREVEATPVPLNEVRGWSRRPDAIAHDSGQFFDIRAVAVTGGNREIDSWTQPMIAPHGLGVVAFLAARIGGVLHVLVNARVEPGYLDYVELAPTVQCTPESYEHLPAGSRPPFVDDVVDAAPDQIRFDTVLSEEGGRFYNARNRYVVVEVDADHVRTVLEAEEGPSRYRWMTVEQMVGLIRHSHYVNVQARSLIACLHSLTVPPGRGSVPAQQGAHQS